MSRIQKRRQAKEIPTEDRNENESGLDRREEVPKEGRGQTSGKDEMDTEASSRSIRGRERRRNNVEDEKPKSDDEDDPKNNKEKSKLTIDPPADIKSKTDDDNNKPVAKGSGRPPRADKEKGSNPIHENNDPESKKDVTDSKQMEKDLEKGPLKILQPLRTDPLAILKSRHKKLERLNAESVPEIHFIGKILSGNSIVKDKSEGGSCR